MRLHKIVKNNGNVTHQDVLAELQKKTRSITVNNWLVVLTILKNISQWEGLSHLLWKIKNV
jgi:hypothetical protein